ncbi:MAG: protein kinase [Archangium gephyra]|uniref:Protein kinase n=1 Tax=Archangium gephyra TaxID=48 RepID=A0A2W5U7S9_9BACT|nr:MAG: protein kinase [Archangium gephyra]
MAEVWRAKTFGAGGFERIVAIKRILPNIAEDEEFITMFIDEAKITVQLNHANIAQIYELANLSNSYFIAMEYVSGKDMRAVFDRCRKRGEPAPIPLTCYAIAQCCEGLDYAHRAKDKQGRDMGIVHRDVSPQNALISYDGEVKVIDFGIAKAAGKATKTQAGILKGKFGYMSPEQIRGLPLDGRSDIFAIGVCLYEMLTGERLFVGDSDFSVLEKVRKVEVLPPSHFNRKIPEQLEKIVMKALAKDVDDRYQHASELGEDLRAFMYSTGNAFARKDLAAFMKATFAEDYEKEKARISEYVEVKAPEGMLAAIEMGYGVGTVPAPNAGAPNASAVTAVPTSVPISPQPGGLPPTVRPMPPTLTPSAGAPVTRPPSLTSMPRLTAVAPMLTNGKEEHESTVLADGIGGGPPFDDPATNPGGGPQQRPDPTRAINIRNRPGGNFAEELATDPGRPAVPAPVIRQPPVVTSVPERRPTRNVAPIPPAADTAPTLAGVSSQRVAPAVAQTNADLPTQAPAPNNMKLIVVLVGIIAVLIIAVAAVWAFKPAANGLLMITVPDGAKNVTVNINGKDVVDDNGQPFTDWPQIRPVPVGKVTVLIKAPGYEPLTQTIDVKEGNEPTQLTKELKKKSP